MMDQSIAKEPRVIHEDAGYIIIDKPAGLLVHPAPIAKEKKHLPQTTLAQWVVDKYPEVARVGDDPQLRPGIVHRLDKETSGVMVVARSQDAFLYLKDLFATRQVQKTYVALCYGIPRQKKGTIRAPIGITKGSVKHSIHSQKNAREAVTDYETLETFECGEGKEKKKYSLVLAHPLTGRTHQIRVHMASIHCPIVGDPLYGPKTKPEWATRLYLHAKSLQFSQSAGSGMHFESELPREFDRAIAHLRELSEGSDLF